MKDNILTITSVLKLQEDIYQIRLSGDCRQISSPGQFINIKLEDKYLRRPISIADYGDDFLDIIFKVVGHGTSDLSELEVGSKLQVLMPLGNGFDIHKGNNTPILIGGGIGLPPIYALAKALLAQGKKPIVIAGFNGEKDIILTEKFQKLGIRPIITTVDGSMGIKGFVTDALAKIYGEKYVFCCGPEPMLKAIWAKVPDGQFSFEARMACGFGVCMGCSCKTKYGYKRICKDGPVLSKEEIIW